MLDLGQDLSGFLATLGQPIKQTAREMIVFELYRRSLVSSGKAAELLGMPRLLDEQPARRLATSLGLRVMGTAGLLMAGKERGFLAKIRPELDRLVAVRFFMDQDLYDRVVAQAGEYLKIQAAGGKSPETLGHRLPVEIGVLRG